VHADPAGSGTVAHMNIPAELRYTKDHEWVLAQDDRMKVGITDYAQDALGDVVFVQLPAVGDTVAEGDALGEVESTKSVSEIYAPVAGTVSEVNLVLEDTPELLNSDPYGLGWLVVITVDDTSVVESLLTSDGYESLIEG
jgi:glycine cleavage system H protein